MKKWGVLLFLFLIGLTAAGFGYYQYQEQKKIASITTFEECAAAGFPVMESFPPRCATPDGRSFTQNVIQPQIPGEQNQTPTQSQTQSQEHSDIIVVDNPKPNQKISSPLLISGKARGTWFFEADFPIELLDGNNKSLDVSHAQAQGEWMTENFVPFEGKIIFDAPETSNGTLIIRNANPSGLPGNQKELIIPVIFK